MVFTIAIKILMMSKLIFVFTQLTFKQDCIRHMSKLPYPAVAENNDREFEGMMRWHLAARPAGSIAGLYHSVVADEAQDHRKLARRAQSQSAVHLGTTKLTEASLVKTSSTPPPQGAVQPNNNDDVLAATTGLKRAHIRRKHRGNCPKHLHNEISRCGGVPAPLDGGNSQLMPATSQRTPSTTNNTTPSTSQPHDDATSLPRLPVPNSIGRGLGDFLAGGHNPHYVTKYYVPRPIVEHPNFNALDAKLDATVTRDGPTYDAKKVHQRAPDWLLDEKLMRDEAPDTKHYRKKYEMKSHMEAVRMMGKALLREFAGAAFK